MRAAVVSGAHGALAGAIVGAGLVALIGHQAFIWMGPGPMPVMPLRLYLIPFAAVVGGALVAGDAIALARERNLVRFLAGFAAAPLAELPAISVMGLQAGALPWQGWKPQELLAAAIILAMVGLVVGAAFGIAGGLVRGATRAAAVKRAFVTVLLPHLPVAFIAPQETSASFAFFGVIALAFLVALALTRPLASWLAARLEDPS
jgi:hypothetical protein